MGAVLLEPARWQAVQTRVHLEDFSEPDLRRLAEIYWAHQRNEGEPVFNELLGVIEEPALKELAVSLLSEVEEQVNLEQGLNGAIESLLWSRTETERRQTQATLESDTSDEEEKLRRIWELSREASRRNANV
jgi:hypothetical protein